MDSFSGFFTSYNTTWVLLPFTDKSSTDEVEDELKKQAREAINNKTPLIWLCWPYFKENDGQDIENVLKEFEKTELKTDSWFRRLVRVGEAPTHLSHDKKARIVILHIKISRG